MDTPPTLRNVERLAGAGGLIFVATLVVQNALRANAPGLDASPTAVMPYFAHPGAAALVPLGLFPIGMLGLFAFVAAIWALADTDECRWWASLGVLGTASIAALFAVVNITEIVLVSKAEQLADAPAVVAALWTLHAAAFGLDLAAIAIALIGLSRTSAAMRLVPHWIATVALLGAVCLLTPAVFSLALTSNAAWMAPALVGFAVWIVFVAMASISLVRRRPIQRGSVHGAERDGRYASARPARKLQQSA